MEKCVTLVETENGKWNTQERGKCGDMRNDRFRGIEIDASSFSY